jgi:hypothetical protein
MLLPPCLVASRAAAPHAHSSMPMPSVTGPWLLLRALAAVAPLILVLAATIYTAGAGNGGGWVQALMSVVPLLVARLETVVMLASPAGAGYVAGKAGARLGVMRITRTLVVVVKWWCSGAVVFPATVIQGAAVEAVLPLQEGGLSLPPAAPPALSLRATPLLLTTDDVIMHSTCTSNSTGG